MVRREACAGFDLTDAICCGSTNPELTVADSHEESGVT